VGLILNMVGLERITALGVVVAAVINVFLNVLLIPFLGTLGAAVATSVSLIVWNVLLAIWLFKATGFVSTLYVIKD
jgi:O-antigen/teichoic acid export membrane protein